MTEDSAGQQRARAQLAIPDDYGCLYDEAYYRTGCGRVPYDRSEPQWPVIFGRIADTLIRSLRPGKVLDAGCGLGFLVEALRDRAVEAWGIDISSFAIANVRRDMKAFCRRGSLAEVLDDHYDLITCIEVLEQMPEADAVQAVRNLTDASDLLLFSSTPFDSGEATHFNVKPTLGWLQLFAEHGFAPDVTFDASFVAPHAMLLRRQPALSGDVLRLFSECIRWRHIAVQNEAEVAAGRTRIAEMQAEANRGAALEAQWAGQQAQLDRAQTSIRNLETEVTAGQTRVAELEAEAASLSASLRAACEKEADARTALTREREYVSTLSTLQEHLMQEAQEIHGQLRGRTGEELDKMEARLLRELASAGSDERATAAQIQELTALQAEMRNEIARVDRRTGELDRIIQGLASRLDSLFQSRTWRMLVSTGGIVLRLTGRKP